MIDEYLEGGGVEAVRLRPTLESDLEYVLALEAEPDTAAQLTGSNSQS